MRATPPMRPTRHPQHNRSYYPELQAAQQANQIYGAGTKAMFEEALDALQAAGHDFSQYDSDGNGHFDLIFLMWSGPSDGFWWPGQNSFFEPSKAYGGVSVNRYISSENGDKWAFTPGSNIHEAGHMLGLEDLYDYNPAEGPPGGVGGLDRMDTGECDHIGLSKWMLDWLTPRVVKAGETAQITLRPSGTHPDVVMVAPNMSLDNPFQEFFLLQYRKRNVGNDAEFGDFGPGGLMIMHVDFRIGPPWYNPIYNQHDTAHKMITLEQADGLDEIEKLKKRSNQGDFFVQGKSFTPTTYPNSSFWDGSVTGVTITDIGPSGDTITFTLSVKAKGAACEVGEEVWNSICVAACPSGATRNAATGVCACNSASEEMINGACVANCVTGSTRNPTTGVCTCNSPLESWNSTCVAACPRGTTRVAATGICGETAPMGPMSLFTLLVCICCARCSSK